ncbi:hypothetical protein [Bryobacter aggregatus]|uniref:hypothetical protein n=1 Tax=Bryobacter aggregatus TaxID=360054 RepID=UPI0012BA66DC|nr:hypothetical protein [Bryobacter aggregatus]
MQFLREPPAASREIAVFCGAFHPPTVAHLALSQAARQHVDAIVWAMPESFPHKSYDTVGRAERLQLVLKATTDAVAVTRENLFFAVAQELRETIPAARIHLLIGEDGVRRLFEWDYGEGEDWKGEYLKTHLQHTPLLSLRRQDQWVVPLEYQDSIRWLETATAHREVSSTQVRDRIASGLDWEHLVPPAIIPEVSRLYGSSGRSNGQ